MNSTKEVNYQLLKLIQYLQQQVATLETNNNITNPPIPTNTRKPPNALNPQNHCSCNTSKYCWSHGACSHTRIYHNMKKTGHKYSETCFENMEGSENYFHTTAE